MSFSKDRESVSLLRSTLAELLVQGHSGALQAKPLGKLMALHPEEDQDLPWSREVLFSAPGPGNDVFLSHILTFPSITSRKRQPTQGSWDWRGCLPGLCVWVVGQVTWVL